MWIRLGIGESQLARFGNRTDGEVTGVQQRQFEIHHLLPQLGDEHVARIARGVGVVHTIE